jgi:hypothetical protein
MHEKFSLIHSITKNEKFMQILYFILMEKVLMNFLGIMRILIVYHLKNVKEMQFELKTSYFSDKRQIYFPLKISKWKKMKNREKLKEKSFQMNSTKNSAVTAKQI